MLSGEAVNANKSNILFSSKVPREAKQAILQILGHKDVEVFKYMGISMRIGKVRVTPQRRGQTSDRLEFGPIVLKVPVVHDGSI